MRWYSLGLKIVLGRHSLRLLRPELLGYSISTHPHGSAGRDPRVVFGDNIIFSYRYYWRTIGLEPRKIHEHRASYYRAPYNSKMRCMCHFRMRQKNAPVTAFLVLVVVLHRLKDFVTLNREFPAYVCSGCFSPVAHGK